MEDEFRLSLLVLGTCFILAVLVHGVWKIRNEKKAQRKMRVDPHTDPEQSGSDDADKEDFEHVFGEFDDGIVVRDNNSTESGAPNKQSAANNEANPSEIQQPNLTSDDYSAANDKVPSTSLHEVEAQQQKAKLYGSVVSNPKPHMRDETSVSTQRAEDHEIIANEPPDFLLTKSDSLVQQDVQVAPNNAVAATDNTPDINREDSSTSTHNSDTRADTKSILHTNNSSDTQNSVDTQLGGRIEPTIGSFQLTGEEPTINDLEEQREYRRPRTVQRRSTSQSAQMRIDLDGNTEAIANANETTATTDDEPEQEVLILNVRANEDNIISGAALLPLLLTLGLKFGDQDIFHRHANANGKGPVLFSLANMFKPGNFDIDNLETFSTQGISLFMILPIEGDAHQVFNMMHNAARKIADEFDAKVLDGRRSVLTRQGLQQYVEKIREFERKRMVRRTS